MASRRRRLRSSYMARSTDSSDGSRMRAQAERYTLAGSVACRQTTPRAASTSVVRAVGRREMVTNGDAGPALGGVDASHRGSIGHGRRSATPTFKASRLL